MALDLIEKDSNGVNDIANSCFCMYCKINVNIAQSNIRIYLLFVKNLSILSAFA